MHGALASCLLAAAVALTACGAPATDHAASMSPMYAAAQSPLSLSPPTGPAAIVLRDALVAEADGHWDEALAAYTDAATEDPASEAAVLGRARALGALGRRSESRTVLESALASAPPSVALLRAAGAAALALGDDAAAADHYGRAVALLPGDAALRCEAGWADLLAGRHDLVISTLEPLPPASLPSDLQLALGRSALLGGRPDLSASVLVAYTRARPAELQGWLDLTRAQLLLGRNQEAMEAVAGAVMVGPGAPETQVLLGHVHARVGHRQAALAAYEKAIQLGADPRPLAPLVAGLKGGLAEGRP